MRTVAWEIASQIALRNCSKEVGGKVGIIYDFSEGGVRAVKHTFQQRLAARHEKVSHEEQILSLMILVLY